MNFARFLIQVCKGIIRSQRVRRTLMFYNVLVLLILCFLGATWLWPWLREHPLIFVGFWALCAWLTLLAVLFSLYDLALVRLDARRLRRELEEQALRGNKSHPTDDSHTP